MNNRNIVISFSGGGCLGNSLFASTSQRDRGLAFRYFAQSNDGEVGHHFPVDDGYDGHDLYGVVKRLETGNCVIVRATYLSVGAERRPARGASKGTSWTNDL